MLRHISVCKRISGPGTCACTPRWLKRLDLKQRCAGHCRVPSRDGARRSRRSASRHRALLHPCRRHQGAVDAGGRGPRCRREWPRAAAAQPRVTQRNARVRRRGQHVQAGSAHAPLWGGGPLRRVQRCAPPPRFHRGAGHCVGVVRGVARGRTRGRAALMHSHASRVVHFYACNAFLMHLCPSAAIYLLRKLCKRDAQWLQGRATSAQRRG